MTRYSGCRRRCLGAAAWPLPPAFPHLPLPPLAVVPSQVDVKLSVRGNPRGRGTEAHHQRDQTVEVTVYTLRCARVPPLR